MWIKRPFVFLPPKFKDEGTKSRQKAALSEFQNCEQKPPHDGNAVFCFNLQEIEPTTQVGHPITWTTNTTFSALYLETRSVVCTLPKHVAKDWRQGHRRIALTDSDSIHALPCTLPFTQYASLVYYLRATLLHQLTMSYDQHKVQKQEEVNVVETLKRRKN